jgi:hypothetical protein
MNNVLFLLIALVAIYTINPMKKNIFLVAFLVAILSLSLISLGAIVINGRYDSLSGYYMGRFAAKCLPLSIIQGIVIYFYLKYKREHENRIGFPTVIIVLIGISIVYAIVKFSMQTRIDNYFDEHMEDIEKGFLGNEKEDMKIFDREKEEIEKELFGDKKRDKLFNKFSWNDLSFSYPKSLKIEKNVVKENSFYQVLCTGDNELIVIAWVYNTDVSLTKLIYDWLKSFRKKAVYLKTGKIFDSTFNDLKSKSMNFEYLYSDQINFYGNLTAFISNGCSVIVMKQSIFKEDLDTCFKMIESTIRISTSNAKDKRGIRVRPVRRTIRISTSNAKDKINENG